MTNIQSAAYERLAWEPGFIPFRFNCGRLRGSDHAYAVTWGAQQHHAGVADLGALYGKIMIWIEIKQDGEAHLPSQIEFRKEIEALGGEYHTVRTLDELEALIERIRVEYGDANEIY